MLSRPQLLSPYLLEFECALGIFVRHDGKRKLTRT